MGVAATYEHQVLGCRDAQWGSQQRARRAEHMGRAGAAAAAGSSGSAPRTLYRGRDRLHPARFSLI